MELHQLRYFVAVADARNFTRAAERCSVSQPSLSQQIIKLEAEIGKPLLDRTVRRVRLTDAGRVLYDRAVEILASVEAASREVLESVDEGQVTVGAIPTVAPYFLPRLLSRFARKCPKAEVKVVETLTEFTLRSCLEGDIDITVVATPIDDEHLTVEPLFTEELLVVMAAGHRFAKKSRVTMKDIAGERFVLLSETHCLGDQIVSFCRQKSYLPVVSCDSAQLLTVQELVGLGQGISLIPKMAADADRSSRRVYRPLAGEKPKRTLSMVWRKGRFQSHLVKRFIDVIRAEAKRH